MTFSPIGATGMCAREPRYRDHRITVPANGEAFQSRCDMIRYVRATRYKARSLVIRRHFLCSADHALAGAKDEGRSSL
jgi:hypothetical protein